MGPSYSVMQSDGKGFDGDVVLVSFNKACRVEDNILYQIYEKHICSDFYNEDFNILQHLAKIHNNLKAAIKPNFISFFKRGAVL